MKQMARRGDRLAWLPGDRWMHEDERLDYTPSEGARTLLGWILATLLVVAAVLAPLAVGGLLIGIFGW
jgi:hypothetical protein